jgi:hypothetical protein
VNNSISNASGIYLDQLNTIPEGYSNNLIWNIAHIIVLQQMLVYKLSGLPMMISDEMVEEYKKAMNCQKILPQSEVQKSTITYETKQIKSDFRIKFSLLSRTPTSAGIVLKSAFRCDCKFNFHRDAHWRYNEYFKKFI